jgi:hypothetical protein
LRILFRSRSMSYNFWSKGKSSEWCWCWWACEPPQHFYPLCIALCWLYKNGGLLWFCISKYFFICSISLSIISKSLYNFFVSFSHSAKFKYLFMYSLINNGILTSWWCLHLCAHSRSVMNLFFVKINFILMLPIIMNSILYFLIFININIVNWNTFNLF